MTDENFDIGVHVQIPRRHFKTLNREAANQGTTVASLIRALIVRAVPEAPIPLHLAGEARDEYIRTRNAEGAIDRTVAIELGLSPSAVARRRSDLNIAPVGKHKQEATS